MSVELLPDSEAKIEKLRILKENWEKIIQEYLLKEQEAIEKYGMEILKDLI